MKLIIPWPHLRAACIFSESNRSHFDSTRKSLVIIDTDGSIYGISNTDIYKSPPHYVVPLKADSALCKPILLEIPQLLPNHVSGVSIELPKDMDEYSYAAMLGHDTVGNPLLDCWAGVGIRYAHDAGWQNELSTLEATKKLITDQEEQAERLHSGNGYPHGYVTEETCQATLAVKTLRQIQDAVNLDPSVLPKLYPAVSVQMRGKHKPVKISLGAVSGVVYSMEAPTNITNELSELEDE